MKMKYFRFCERKIFIEDKTAQSAGAVEYANCISAEGLRPHHLNECPEYDT